MAVTRTKYLVSQIRAVPQLSSAISINNIKNSQPVNQHAVVKLQIAGIGLNKKLDEMDKKTTSEGEILQPLPAKRMENNMTLKSTIWDSVLEQRQRKST